MVVIVDNVIVCDFSWDADTQTVKIAEIGRVYNTLTIKYDIQTDDPNPEDE